MNKMYKLIVVISSLFLLVSCGSDANKAVNKKSESKSVIINAYEDSIQDTPLQGKIVGDVNGKAFTYFNEKERPGKIRKSNSGQSLNLTFSTLATTILTINEHAYKGADTYNSASNFKLLDMRNPKAHFKNKDNSKLTILEDDETHVKGSFSFATLSDKNEEIVINATFDLTKIVIDPNDQEALLKEIKENPSSIQSLGDLKSDKDFILKAISINQLAFRYADKSLKSDRGFILKAMQENPKRPLLMFADKELKSDKDFALKAVKINVGAFYLLDKKLKKDKGFALKALKINSKVFNFLDKTLKKDKDIFAASKLK